MTQSPRSLNHLAGHKMWLALLVCAMASSSTVRAQDQQFTQFNAAPTSFNPAYAGVSGQARLVSLYRAQWTALPQAFTGLHIAFDRPTLDKKMGFGFLLSNEQAGAGALNRTQFMAQAAHNLRLGRRLNLRTGMQMGFGARSINMNSLVFMDQILRDHAEVSLEQGIGIGTQYVDMGAGMMLLSRRVWFGASAHHLTSPNVSLNPALPEQLDMLLTGHGGARIQLARGPRGRFRRDFVVSWKYMQQGRRNQLDIGTYYDMTLFTLGMWYRGIPVQANEDGSLDTDALSFVFGFGTGDLKLGYSYDITLNQLGVLNTGGSHEFSVKYLWDVARRRDPRPPYHPCVEY